MIFTSMTQMAQLLNSHPYYSDPDADSSNLVREQVDVLYYKPADQASTVEFAVDLFILPYSYQVVLACVPKQNNLGETVTFVEQKIFEFKQDPDYEQLRKLQPASDFQSADSLIFPDVFYRLTHHFAELEDKAIGNQPWLDQGYFIYQTMQMIDFTLGGIILRDRINSPPWLRKPRSFHFDKPFLVYIKKREPSASPFFVMWVDNAELMKEFVPDN